MKRHQLAFGCCLVLALSGISGFGCSSNDDGGTPAADPTAGAADTGPAPTAPGGGLDAAVTDPNSDAGPAMVDSACGGTMMKASARDANLLLVLDRSGSMLQKPTGFSVSKWDAVKIALREALNPVKGKIALGLEMYPNGVAAGDACVVPSGASAITVPVSEDSVDMIVDAVNSATPAGATPTTTALARANEYFTTGAGKDLKGDKYVILATDGGPNCDPSITCGAETCTTNIDGSCDTGGNCCDPSRSKISCLDDKGVIAQIDALRASGVKTFVVGIPGTEAYKSYLDQFAEHGGMMATSGGSKYYAVSAEGGVAGLTAVFSLITGELITSCRITLDVAPPDPSQVNVYVDEKVIPRGGDDGWDYDGTTTPPTITIKGSTCDQVKTKGAKVISVSYGCPTIQ